MANVVKDLNPLSSGESLLVAIRRSGIDQATVARRVGMHPTRLSQTINVAHLNCAPRPLDRSECKKLGKVLKVSPAILFAA